MSDILYTYHGQLYVNLTNRCPCACTFCVRSQTRSVGSAEDLWLEHEPSVEEVKQALEITVWMTLMRLFSADMENQFAP